jgi:hypothetical protein
LPLDDCLYALQAAIPHLTRSSLHRCLQRHGISRLPEVEADKQDKRKFKSYPLGYFHIDIAEVRTEQGKLHLFVAMSRRSSSRHLVAELVERGLKVDYRPRKVKSASGNSSGFFCPSFADELVGCEALESLQSTSEVIGAHEIGLAFV